MEHVVEHDTVEHKGRDTMEHIDTVKHIEHDTVEHIELRHRCAHRTQTLWNTQ